METKRKQFIYLFFYCNKNILQDIGRFFNSSSYHLNLSIKHITNIQSIYICIYAEALFKKLIFLLKWLKKGGHCVWETKERKHSILFFFKGLNTSAEHFHPFSAQLVAIVTTAADT